MCGHPSNLTNGKPRISRSTGKPCRKRRLVGATACEHHGGCSQGARNPAYKHGRYVTSIPGRFQAKYEQAQKDPNLLSLRNEIHLIDVRLRQVLEGLSEEVDREADLRQWRLVLDLIERRERVVASERKRLVEMQQVITLDQLRLLIDGTIAVIRAHVKDHTVLHNISAGIGKLLDQRDYVH